MNPHEKTIASAAVEAPRKPTYEELNAWVCERTGIDRAEVDLVIGRLVKDLILVKRGGPVHNLASGVVGGIPAKGWYVYEKGATWAD